MQQCTAEDGYTALLRTEGGASVVIDGTSTNPVERPNRVVVIGSEGVLELVNENPREEDARIVLHGPHGPKEMFTFQQGNTYNTQMQEWAQIIRDSVRRGAAEPDAPTFADGLACSRVMDLLARRARSDDNRSDTGGHVTAADAVADRLALIDLVNRYVDMIDAKQFEALDDWFTEDATVWWNPESSTTGRAPIVAHMRRMLDTERHRDLPPRRRLHAGHRRRPGGRGRADPRHAQRRGPARRSVLGEPRHPDDTFRPDRGRMALQRVRMEGGGGPRQPRPLRWPSAGDLREAVKLLAGKVAIVTGAGSGVGRGIAIALARAGAHVVVSSRTVSKCETAVKQIDAAGGSAIAVACDVKRRTDIDECVARTLGAYGGVDILVNAADDPRVDVPILELTDEVMNASWQTGVMGTLRFIQACVPQMLQRGEGAIVNVASGAGLLAPVGMGAYSAAQEAIRSLTRTAAVELGPQGIRVNVICPVASGSESLDRWVMRDPERLASYVANTPLRRVGDPVDDVGEGTVFLCGPQSRYVTGTTLMLDGGRSYLR